jgi:choline kinase
VTEVAVLLCAGSGTRLRPLTDDCPKALVDVGGETILGRAVRLLVAAGVTDLVVATGYRADSVRAALARCASRVTFCHNPAFDRTQNSVSLGLCEKAVGGRAFLKLDGDLLFHADVIGRLSAERAPLVAAVERNPSMGCEEMKVKVERGRILAFGKQLDPRSCYGESIGIERIGEGAASRLFLALASAAAQGDTDLYYEDVYGRLIDAGLEAAVADVTDLPWIEVDTPEDLDRARDLVRSGQLDLARTADGA